ncbi:single insulin-like growth factor-binding domain protein-1 [Palaemon carinicauda]|uniref:single insulin-like growth factor-binding domain protein-1 n=1 Tax=Palaemon carinicauda TaxID=392227 RepID=UPI0035B5C861
MKIHLLALVILCVGYIRSSMAFLCPCWDLDPDELDCPPEKTLEECPYGATYDICLCCPNNRCLNGPGDRCGGDYDLNGPCAEGLTCRPYRGGEQPGLYDTCQEDNVRPFTGKYSRLYSRGY